MAPDDIPRDFGPVIAFSDICREAVRERNVCPPDHTLLGFFFLKKPLLKSNKNLQ